MAQARILFVPSMLTDDEREALRERTSARRPWRIRTAVLSTGGVGPPTPTDTRPVVVFGSLADLPAGATIYVADPVDEEVSDAIRAIAEDPDAPRMTFSPDELRFLDSLVEIGIGAATPPEDGDEK